MCYNFLWRIYDMEKIYNESKHQFEFSNFENGLQIKKIENKEEIDGEFTIDELSDLKL